MACIALQQEESSDTATINNLNYFVENEELSLEDLTEIADVTSSLNIADDAMDSMTDMLHAAGRNTLMNSNNPSNQVSISNPNIEM